jgi:hypothetical protein
MAVTLQVAMRAGQPKCSGGQIGRVGFLSDHAMIAATARQAATVIDAKTISMDIDWLRVGLLDS